LPDDPLNWALAAIATVGVALLISQFSYGRVVAVLLSLAGTLLAGLSLLGLERRVWLGWMGVALNGFAFLLLAAFPASLGVAAWWPDPEPETQVKAETAVVDEWVDAADAAWELDGVRVALTFATIGTDPSSKAARGKGERYVWIGVVVTNVGSRPVEFTAWDLSTTQQPLLITADNTHLKLKRLGGAPAKKTIAPGKLIECLLAFEPAQTADQGDLLLELPAGAFGGTTPVRFRIPHTSISRK
jgi:hypothetical protein